ncbi:hypothetical protein LDENG_00232160 [Lucifuga dentata]|nr:hypothetical protein LDENG_00232160 [Lucifuga dentata]
MCMDGGRGMAAAPPAAEDLRETGGEEAEWLAVVGGQRRAVTLKGPWNAATGGTRAVTESLYAALPLQL